ncbi:hypothetical protein ANCDUO_27749 [Ancylostoma duodenale]|uniref:Ribosomal protein L55 n=1 Tax=Ancylostoma duodenale TaxID=51022 RepID=A0A0C2BEU2_9BILA|nr:hypothetical protein ANCDUO_27749 [Ancylostoma duodenale]
MFYIKGAILSLSERGNAWRACLGKICRSQYLRHYPVRLIRPDGSSIEIRYLEPRSVVQLPVDVNALSEDEKRQRLAARKPKAKKIVQETIDDNFDASEYMKFWSPQEPKEKPKKAQPQEPEEKPKKAQKMK